MYVGVVGTSTVRCLVPILVCAWITFVVLTINRNNMATRRERVIQKDAKMKAMTIPINEKLKYWAFDPIEAFRRNFKTQGIFPVGEPYPGYKEKNDKVKGNSWKSTGAGYDSFDFHVLAAADSQNLVPPEVAVKFMYNYYLKFVDMGVMKGLPADSVVRSSNAVADRCFFETWDPKTGHTHRPAISMEMEYQTRRLTTYMAHRYEYAAKSAIIEVVDGFEITINK